MESRSKMKKHRKCMPSGSLSFIVHRLDVWFGSMRQQPPNFVSSIVEAWWSLLLTSSYSNSKNSLASWSCNMASEHRKKLNHRNQSAQMEVQLAACFFGNRFTILFWLFSPHMRYKNKSKNLGWECERKASKTAREDDRSHRLGSDVEVTFWTVWRNASFRVRHRWLKNRRFIMNFNLINDISYVLLCRLLLAVQT